MEDTNQSMDDPAPPDSLAATAVSAFGDSDAAPALAVLASPSARRTSTSRSRAETEDQESDEDDGISQQDQFTSDMDALVVPGISSDKLAVDSGSSEPSRSLSSEILIMESDAPKTRPPAESKVKELRSQLEGRIGSFVAKPMPPPRKKPAPIAVGGTSKPPSRRAESTPDLGDGMAASAPETSTLGSYLRDKKSTEATGTPPQGSKHDHHEKKDKSLSKRLFGAFTRHKDSDDKDAPEGKRGSEHMLKHQMSLSDLLNQEEKDEDGAEKDAEDKIPAMYNWNKRHTVYASIVDELKTVTKTKIKKSTDDEPSISASSSLTKAQKALFDSEFRGRTSSVDFASSGASSGSGLKPLDSPVAVKLMDTADPASSSSSGTGSADTNERIASAVELVTTEKTYLHSLEVVNQDIIRFLKAFASSGVKPIVSLESIPSMFSTFGEMYNLHKKLYGSLTELRQRGDSALQEGLPDVIIKFSPFFKIYYDFTFNFNQCQENVKEERRRNGEFDRFLKVVEFMHEEKLESMMIKPVQRIPRYELLLVRIRKACRSLDESNPDNVKFIAKVQEALEKIQTVTKAIEANMEISESRFKVVEIQEKFFKNKITIVKPTRSCVRIGRLKKWLAGWTADLEGQSSTGTSLTARASAKLRSKSRQYVFILFNDVLLYCSPPDKARAAQIKGVLKLEGLTVENFPDTEEVANGFVINSEDKSLTVVAETEKEKKDWLDDLRYTIRKYYEDKDTRSTIASATSPVSPLSAAAEKL